MPPMTGLTGEYFAAPPEGAEAVGDATLIVVSSNLISSSWSSLTYVNVESWLKGVDSSSSLLCMETVLMALEGT